MVCLDLVWGTIEILLAAVLFLFTFAPQDCGLLEWLQSQLMATCSSGICTAAITGAATALQLSQSLIPFLLANGAMLVGFSIAGISGATDRNASVMQVYLASRGIRSTGCCFEWPALQPKHCASAAPIDSTRQSLQNNLKQQMTLQPQT